MSRQVICIGASAGGVTAVRTILGLIHEDCRASLLVVQHFPEDAAINAELLYGGHYKGRIVEVIDKLPVEPATAYFAPPGYHLQIERDGILSLNQDDPVQFARPSIDVLFESAAWSLGPRAWGILLTGANSDGAAGLRSIQNSGGITIVQNPEEAEVSYMPKSALEIMRPDYVLTLTEIAGKISKFRGERPG